jgi:hypothetical protein
VQISPFIQMGKRKKAIAGFAVLLAAIVYAVYTFWYNTPEKALERYLSLIVSKQGEEAYEYVYKESGSYYPKRGDFVHSAKTTKLLDFKVLGVTKADNTSTEVKVLLQFARLDKEKVFTMKKIFGKWQVVLHGPDGNGLQHTDMESASDPRFSRREV